MFNLVVKVILEV